MVHQAASPFWLLILALAILVLMIVGFVHSSAVDRADQVRKQRQREDRRRKQTAYRRALAWLKRRPRHLQLRDMRSEAD